eukprot:COSAG01_NODE_55708_length_323_cov_0.906250_1_plen_31_part_01
MCAAAGHPLRQRMPHRSAAESYQAALAVDNR